jgi:hypothetical protein
MRAFIRSAVVPLALMAAIELAAPSNAWAQSNATFVPSLSVSTVYDDNLFASTRGDVGVMSHLRPAFEMNYESPKLTFLSFGSFDMQRSNHSSLNTLDARRHGQFDLHYQGTPATIFGFAMRYDRTETPGEINIDSGFLGPRRTAERLEANPSILFRVRPRTSIALSYNGTTESLIDDIRGTLHVARAGVTRQTSTRDEVTVSYLGRTFYDVIGTDTSHAALLGWTRELAYATRLTLQGGPRVSSYTRGIRPEFSAGLTRRTGILRTALDYWHGETIVLGIRGPVAVDSATARLIWTLVPRFELGTHFGVSDSTTLDDENLRVYRVNIVGSWTPHGGPYTLATTYGADFQQGIIRRTILTTDDEVLRHTVRITLTIAPRYSRAFRPTGERPDGRPEGGPQ